jgi:hypothetical protein
MQIPSQPPRPIIRQLQDRSTTGTKVHHHRPFHNRATRRDSESLQRDLAMNSIAGQTTYRAVMQQDLPSGSIRPMRGARFA